MERDLSVLAAVLRGPIMFDPSSSKDAYNRSIGLLANREHSVKELTRKLASKGFDEIAVTEAVQKLQENGSQSDDRFTQAYISMRSRRGYGPVRIRMELQERGIDESLISEYLDTYDESWVQLALEVQLKKFGAGKAADFNEQAKRKKFLQYRGFSFDHISQMDEA